MSEGDKMFTKYVFGKWRTKWPLCTSKPGWEDVFKTVLKNVGFGTVTWIEIGQ